MLRSKKIEPRNQSLIFSDVFYKGNSAKDISEMIYDAGHPLKLSEEKMLLFSL